MEQPVSAMTPVTSNSTSLFQMFVAEQEKAKIDPDVVVLSEETTRRLKIWRPSKIDCWAILEILETEVDRSILYRHAKTQSIKETLLELSLRSFSSDVVLTVILYIRDTSDLGFFVKMLSKYGSALVMYARYLEQSLQLKRLLNLLQLFQAKLAEGKLYMREAFRQKAPRVRYANIRFAADFFARTFRDLPKHTHEFDYWFEVCRQQADLLDRQVQVEEFDSKVADSGQEEIYRRFPPRSIVFSSLQETLYYFEFYHPTSAVGKLSSPVGLARTFDMSEKKALWTALRARAMLQDWAFLQEITTKRGLFSVKPKSKIGFEPFVEICHAYKAPQAVLDHFIMCIKNTEHRIEVAHQYNAYNPLIETFIQKRDVDAMFGLLEFMDGDIAAAYLYGKYRNKIYEALCNPNIKWNKSRKGYILPPASAVGQAPAQ